MSRILLLNGPNLNLLGLREPAIYGASTLQAIEVRLQERARALQIDLLCLQSNAEHELLRRFMMHRKTPWSSS